MKDGMKLNHNEQFLLTTRTAVSWKRMITAVKR